MPVHPTFREACQFWLKLGFISFGGPTGQIAILHTELVEKKKWIGEGRFLHALNYCMLLPGPEATQLAIYCGWLLHGTWGGIVAGTLFILPAAVLLWGLSYIYAAYGSVPWLAAIFYGLKPAVTAIVIGAVINIGRRVLKTRARWGIAALAFGALYFIQAPFPLVILGAALVGLAGGIYFPASFRDQTENRLASERTVIDDAHPLAVVARSWRRRAIKVVTISVLLWLTPVLAAGLWQGWGATLTQQGIFFSQAAWVTFGGAYAVLPYVGQQAVDHYGWLSGAQMLDGLGLAETTPGPLIIVVQFVGFLGGWNQPGPLAPFVAATLGAALTTWTTFVPSFLLVFLGAPYIEKLRGNQRLNATLSAVTAAVVGVVLNLAVWFAHQVVFPRAGNVDGFAVVLAVVVLIALLRFRVGVVPVILASGALGLATHFW